MMPKGECHRCTGVKKSSGAFRPQAGEKGSQAGEKIIGCIGLSGWWKVVIDRGDWNRGCCRYCGYDRQGNCGYSMYSLSLSKKGNAIPSFDDIKQLRDFAKGPAPKFTYVYKWQKW